MNIDVFSLKTEHLNGLFLSTVATFEYSYSVSCIRTNIGVSVAVFVEKHTSLRIQLLLHKL